MKKYVLLCDSMEWFPNAMRPFMIHLPFRLDEIKEYVKNSNLNNVNSVKNKCLEIICKEIKEHLNNNKLQFFLIVLPASYSTDAPCDRNYVEAFLKILSEINLHDVEVLDITESKYEIIQKNVSKEKLVHMTPDKKDIMGFSKKFHAYLEKNDLHAQYQQ